MFAWDCIIIITDTTVPIIPEFLYDIRHPNATLDSLPRVPLTTPIPCDRPIDGTEVTTISAGKNMHPFVIKFSFDQLFHSRIFPGTSQKNPYIFTCFTNVN